MSYDKVQVGNRIRGSRFEKGWTQERLAAEAEISVQQLRALEKGQRNLGVDHLGRLSDAMGVLEASVNLERARSKFEMIRYKLHGSAGRTALTGEFYDRALL